MNIKSDDLLYFSFHEGFTERLLSGDFRLKDSGKIEYELKYFPSGSERGALSLPMPLAERILEIACSGELESLPEQYCGGWDDLGGSYFEFRNGNGVKTVRIEENIERDTLSSNIEKGLFNINDELIRLASTLVSNKKKR